MLKRTQYDQDNDLHSLVLKHSSITVVRKLAHEFKDMGRSSSWKETQLR